MKRPNTKAIKKALAELIRLYAGPIKRGIAQS